MIKIDSCSNYNKKRNVFLRTRCSFSLVVQLQLCAYSAGEAVTAAHSLSAGDDWLGFPATSRSNFSNWLNKENFQLQQTGTRYRVNEFIDRRLIDRPCPAPVTSSIPGTAHLRDVTRTRAHNDPAADALRNVRFDDVKSTAIPLDHALSYAPADDVNSAINHAHTSISK